MKLLFKIIILFLLILNIGMFYIRFDANLLISDQTPKSYLYSFNPKDYTITLNQNERRLYLLNNEGIITFDLASYPQFLLDSLLNYFTLGYSSEEDSNLLLKSSKCDILKVEISNFNYKEVQTIKCIIN